MKLPQRHHNIKIQKISGIFRANLFIQLLIIKILLL